MHDTLNYFQRDPVHRKYHQNDLTFAMLYHHHENFILPLSHDEVVHGKGSLLRRMPGDDWQRFANLRTLLSYQWLFPGKKLLFMGGEFGQSAEWNANSDIDWWLLDAGPYHAGLQRMMEDLNRLYLREPALWESDHDVEGFYWLDCSDAENSTMSFVRQNRDRSSQLAVLLNFTPVGRSSYRLGLPHAGAWHEVFNSDAQIYAGGNQGNWGKVEASAVPWHNQPNSAEITVPPMGAVVLKYGG
jgi:1,4-alpha-glucan branching enzyme